MKLFISYRRQDSAYAVILIKERLELRFGRDSVFVDVDNIPYGTDFRARIASAVSESDAMLVLIGNAWMKDYPMATSKLLQPDDYVCAELEAAFEYGIPVVPVLLESASMPNLSDLPLSLRSFSDLNATNSIPATTSKVTCRGC